MWQGNARMRNIWVHTGQRSFLSDSFKRSLVQCWWASWLTLPPLLHPHPYPPHYESQPSSTSPEAQTGVRDMFWPKHGAWEKSPEAKQGSELCMQGCKSITFQRAWGSQGDLWLGTPGSQSDVCKDQSCSNSNTGPAGFLEAVRLSKSCLGNHLCLFLAGFPSKTASVSDPAHVEVMGSWLLYPVSFIRIQSVLWTQSGMSRWAWAETWPRWVECGISQEGQELSCSPQGVLYHLGSGPLSLFLFHWSICMFLSQYHACLLITVAL